MEFPVEEESLLELTPKQLVQALFETAPTPLFYAANPATILYGKLGEEPAAVKLEDFEKQGGFIWSNSPVTGSRARDRLFKNLNIPRSLITLTNEILCNPFNDFAIFEINETANKGVFYWPTKNHVRDVLTKGRSLCVYSGSLGTAAVDNAFFEYGFLIDDPGIQNSAFTDAGFGSPFINGQQFRNIGPLMNHAPSEKKLDQIAYLPEELKKYVVTANISFSPTLQLGIPGLLARTLRDIHPKEQLVFDYGEYGKKAYQLFDITGQIIGTVNSENQFEVNPDYIPCDKLAPRCTAKIDEEAEKISAKQQLLACDSLSHYLVTNMAFVIELFQRRKIPGSEQVFADMLACFDPTNNPSLVNQALHKIVVIDKRLEKYPNLLPLYGELCIHFSQIEHRMKQLKTLEERFNKKTGKTWKMTYDAQSKMGLCLFGKKPQLREYKKEISWIPAIVLQINNKDALMVYFSALMIDQKQLEEQPAAKISGNKKTTAPTKKK